MNRDVRIAAAGWFPKCNHRALQISALEQSRSQLVTDGHLMPRERERCCLLGCFFSACLEVDGDNQGIKLHQAS